MGKINQLGRQSNKCRSSSESATKQRATENERAGKWQDTSEFANNDTVVSSEQL